MQNKSFLLSEPKSILCFPFVYQNTMLCLSDRWGYFQDNIVYEIIFFGNSHMQTCWIVVSQGFVFNPPINKKRLSSKYKSRLWSLMHFLQKFFSLFHYTFCSFKDSFDANQRDFVIVRDSLRQIIHSTDVLVF